MSDALVCLSETVSFYAQDNNENCFKYDTSSVINPNKKCSKSEMIEDDQIVSMTQDENHYANQNCKDDIIHRQIVSRKREASNILMECVKRRDNLRNIDFISNVPSSDLFKPECNVNTLIESLDNQISTPNGEKGNRNVKNEDIYPKSASVIMDSSDSSSAADSGIESLSKSSSPSHSIDNISSKSYIEEEESKHFMDIDVTNTPAPSLNDEFICINPAEQSNGSSAAIYEDLNCLHLTDESARSYEEQSQDKSISLKSPITQSLFKSVSSTIYFACKEETVAAMPDHILPHLKWKLSSITPVLVRDTLLKSGFCLLDADTTEEWIGTWGKHLKCTYFKRIKNFQKVNHYPGNFHLGRKDKLWDNYKRMQIRHGAKAYNFFPETFRLPAELKSLKKAWENENEKCWIVKPPASARGTGVKVIYKWSQVPKNRPAVVQRYVSEPYLINGTKFDLRIYVLVPSIEPLRIYVFEDGLVRFASEKYSMSNKSFGNRFIHLTNYSINKRSSSYTSNEDENTCQGHKWSLKSFWTYMSGNGINVDEIKDTIIDMIIKTIICTEGPMCRLMKTYARSTYNCFELFGFDIMLDKNLRPWLLEVNISPSLHSCSTLDFRIKGQLVKDMFNIVGFQVPEKNFFEISDQADLDYGIATVVGSRHKSLRYKFLSDEEKQKHSVYTFENLDEKSDILNDLTADDIRCLIESEDEYNRKGYFIRVFPSETSSKYFTYFEHTRYYNLLLDAWEKHFHANRNSGIQRLQEMCEKKLHLQTSFRESTHNPKEPAAQVLSDGSV